MKSKQKQKQRNNNPFLSAIKDIKKLTQNYMNMKEKNLFKSGDGKQKQKGQKMPIQMLKGMRKKIIQTYKIEKQKLLNENILYDSQRKINSSQFIEKKLQKDKNKNNYMKEKYKYKDMKSKSFGSYKNGTLKLSPSELKRIKGKKSR